MYVSVAENPYTALKPVLEVPMLSFANFVSPKITDGEAQTAENWMKEQYPEMSIYECIDYVEGDLRRSIPRHLFGGGRSDLKGRMGKRHRRGMHEYLFLSARKTGTGKSDMGG